MQFLLCLAFYREKKCVLACTHCMEKGLLSKQGILSYVVSTIDMVSTQIDFHWLV